MTEWGYNGKAKEMVHQSAWTSEDNGVINHIEELLLSI
jgi:hypothetical protein